MQWTEWCLSSVLYNVGGRASVVVLMPPMPHLVCHQSAQRAAAWGNQRSSLWANHATTTRLLQYAQSLYFACHIPDSDTVIITFFSHTYCASWYYQSFFIHQMMHKGIVLKTILKFTLKLTLKQLRHVSVQSHHHQGAYYSCLLKLQLLK